MALLKTISNVNEHKILFCLNLQNFCFSSKATPPKPGSCPKVRPGQVGACVDLCNDDKDCPGEHKCCSNGCGHSCQKPSTGE